MDLESCNLQIDDNECFYLIQINMENENRQITAVEINVQKLQIQFTQFFDTQFYNHLESFLIQWNLLNSGELQKKKVFFLQEIKNEIYKLNPLYKRIQQFHTLQILSQLHSQTASDFSQLIKLEDQHKIANLQVQNLLNQIFNYEGFLEQASYFQKFSVKPYGYEEFLIIDSTVLNALSIFQENEQKNDISIYQFFNQFITTKMGSRVLKKWFMQPHVKIEEINYRINSVQMYLQNKDISKYMKEFLNLVPDLDLILIRLSKVIQNQASRASLKDCYSIYQFAQSLENLQNFMKKCAHSNAEQYLLDVINDVVNELKSVMIFLKTALDFEKIETHREIFVNPNFSQELLNLNMMIQKKDQLIRRLQLETQNEIGGVVEINQELKQGIAFEVLKNDHYDFLKKSSVYKILSIKKRKISFTCQELNMLNEQISDLQNQYINQQKTVEKEIIQEVSKYYQQLELANYIFVEQDIFHAFSQVYQNPKNSNKFCFPKFTTEKDNHLILKSGWHISVDNCVPNDCEMIRNETEFILLTGPNMGGKSTYIRTIAICVLLAHVGAPVPAQSLQLSLMSGIFTRTGANDDQIIGRSTFMNEMVETSNMLHQIDEKSFVIIDELGRGTSVYEGLGLSQAICEYIIEQKKCFTLFATHFSELTHLDQQFKVVKNCHMKINLENEDLDFSYKVYPGKSLRSYGIELIKRLKFPEEVINTANNNIHKFETQEINQQSYLIDFQSFFQQYYNHQLIQRDT